MHDYLLKMVMVGDTNTGKSQLLWRYTEDRDAPNMATIGVDFKMKTLSFDDIEARLQIWDTAGQERFRTITLAYSRGADALLLMFNPVLRRGFERLGIWLDDVRSSGSNGLRFIVCHNASGVDEAAWDVSRAEAEQYALLWGLPVYFVDSHHHYELDSMFSAISRACIDNGMYKLPPAPRTWSRVGHRRCGPKFKHAVMTLLLCAERKRQLALATWQPDAWRQRMVLLRSKLDRGGISCEEFEHIASVAARLRLLELPPGCESEMRTTNSAEGAAADYALPSAMAMVPTEIWEVVIAYLCPRDWDGGGRPRTASGKEICLDLSIPARRNNAGRCAVM